MLAAGSGSIVNIASIAGLRGVSHRAAYNASKHGLVGLTSTLAAEWGGRGVRVNAVCPGWIKTEMDDEDQASGGYTDADITGQVPLARFASPATSRRRSPSSPIRPGAASSTASRCPSTAAGRRTRAGSAFAFVPGVAEVLGEELIQFVAVDRRLVDSLQPVVERELVVIHRE